MYEKDLMCKNPPAKHPTAATNDSPPQQRFTDTDNTGMEEIMEILLHHKLPADQTKNS
jgi:hypothetical protein